MADTKYPYSILIFLFILFSGCGKEEEIPLNLEGEYRTGNTLLAANPIIMYTSSGRVDNQAVIDQFLKRVYPSNPSYFSRSNVTLPPDGAITLAIRANNRAVLMFNYQNQYDPIETEITSREVNYFVLTNMDSTGFGPIIQVNSYPNACEQFAQSVNLVHPGRRCRPVSVVAGTFDKVCKERPVRVIRIRDRKLFIPQFSWLFTNTYISPSGGKSLCGQAQSNQWNLLDPAAPGKLRSGDTLVVQERQVELLKQ
ncbi:hypothetical protein CDA63_09365 [Hymenobacter amundsenii]|uniref:Lipoprotein n=1 Tax=Hymenobacter amundsenii TaxID=2006685 RepID=A0A246FL09_9BACT|nr:hypothetical protein [Hymenobacter amundsenii]OWP63403.1 hypothetical protein CDA63_09365 [Hymenobacter amundsenii]